LAAKRSHFDVHPAISIVDVRPAQGAERGSNMAFRKARDTVEHEQPAETEVEGEIREFVRRDVVTNLGRQPEDVSERVASNINSVLQQPQCRKSTSSSPS
jgi:hypothetical protein